MHEIETNTQKQAERLTTGDGSQSYTANLGVLGLAQPGPIVRSLNQLAGA